MPPAIINLPDDITLGGNYEGAELFQYVHRITSFVAMGGKLAANTDAAAAA